MEAKILIFGKGYLGGRLAEYFGSRASVSEADITDLAALRAEISSHKPAIVINAAGKTQTGELEKPENQSLAFTVNVQGPANLGLLAHDLKFRLVHVSTGMMFDGLGPEEKGFKEEDLPTPTSYYTWTKAWADWLLYPFLEQDRILITRIHLPISRFSSPRNLLDKLRRFDRVMNESTSATVVEDYLSALDGLLKKEASGVYHVVNPGTITHWQIVGMLKEAGLVEPEKPVQIISKEELAQNGIYQPNPYLNTDKLRAAGIDLPELHTAIQNCINNFS